MSRAPLAELQLRKLQAVRIRQPSAIPDDWVHAPSGVEYVVPASSVGITARCEAEATISGGLTIVVADPLMIDWPGGPRTLRGEVSADWSRSDAPAATTHRVSVGAVTSGRFRLVCVTPKRVLSPEFAELFVDTQVGKVIVDQGLVDCSGECRRAEQKTLANALRLSHPSASLSVLRAIEPYRARSHGTAPIDVGDGVVLATDIIRSTQHYMVIRRSDAPLAQLVTWLYDRRGLRGVVYCPDEAEVAGVACVLRALGYRVICGDRYRKDRKNAARASGSRTQRGEIRVLCTGKRQDANWSGIDFVVHTHMPPSLSGYLLDIRAIDYDEGDATCVMFYGPEDVELWKERLRGDHQGGQCLADLNRMQAYCLTTDCRHLNILSYLKDSYVLPARGVFSCYKCDNCLATHRACYGDDVGQA